MPTEMSMRSSGRMMDSMISISPRAVQNISTSSSGWKKWIKTAR